MRSLLFTLSFALLCGSCAMGSAVRHKQIFLVIDDAGLELAETRQFLDLPIPMTIAVLPHLKKTELVCNAILDCKEKEIILHQPMEAYDRAADTGPGTIHNTTFTADVPKILDRNLASVRGAKGINNHMGSRTTENEVLMAEVLRYCRTRDLYFLDSKTAYNSVVERVANRNHSHYEGRDVFLDIQHDRASVRKAWESTVRKASEQGYVIAIGHIWSKETASAIRDSYHTLINQGYTFHVLSELYE
jgi:polysaccharide deacetylase 2 family uncharacterized protein YibQ